MLVLSRKVGERIVIGNNVVITVVAVRGQQIRLGIEAPPSVVVKREELIDLKPDCPTVPDQHVPSRV